MTILSIDTATRVCSAAIWQGPSRMHGEDVNHARMLPLFLEEILGELREQGKVPEAVALSEGPGSYTGLRIGSSTAKGLCYAWDIPLIPIPTTEVLCATFLAQREVEKDAVLCPMIDARRMEVYTAFYTTDLQPLCDIHAHVVDDAAAFFAPIAGKAQKVYCFGDGAEKCRELFGHADATISVEIVADIVPDARYMGAIAAARVDKAVRGKDLAYYEPFYLKEFVAAPSHVKGLE